MAWASRGVPPEVFFTLPVRRATSRAWLFLFALMAGYAECLEAQSGGAGPVVTAFLGYTGEDPDGVPGWGGAPYSGAGSVITCCQWEYLGVHRRL